MGFAEKGFWRFSYQKLAPSATAAGVMDVDETEEAQVSQARRPRSFCRIPDRWLVVGLVLSNLVLLLALAIHATRRPPCHDDAQRRLMAEWYTNSGINDDLKRTSAYSPILDWFDMKPGMRTLNGALRDNASIWRQPPSPEVDRAWDDISTEGFEVITVPESAVVRSGKDPAVSLRAPRSWGAGEDAYVAQIDVFHQIHCLNELRKEMDYDYYYQSSRSCAAPTWAS
ncbi:hypothetical protein VTK73DRAFT_2867 [Phialemonium thermophilum]|uniref:Uncharacterized protein n=1 Tax=Phialemonium thermophilum TaxID=223376 RepID=A0ABR3VQZ2_9PEZI